MSKVYNPFEKNEVSEKDNWFSRAAATITTISIAGLAFTKLPNPLRSLVNKHFNKQKHKIGERAIIKQLDSQEFQLGKGASVNIPRQSIEIDTTYKDQRIKEVEEIDRQFAIDLAKKAKRTEETLIRRAELDINQSNNKVFLQKMPGVPLIPNDIFFAENEIDEFLFQLRRNSLFEYMSRKLEMNPGDQALIETYGDEKQNAQKIKNLHEQYMTDRSYAETYNKNLNTTFKIYKAQKAISDRQSIMQKSLFEEDKKFSEALNKEDIKNRINGKYYFADTIVDAANQVYIGRHLKKPIEPPKDVFALLSKGEKVTSGNLDKTFKVGDDPKFALLSKFDYTPQLQRIAKRINELRNERADACNIGGVSMEIVHKSNLERQQYHLVLTFSHKNRKTPETLSIPLSQHGVIPGSSPNTTPRLDAFYRTQEAEARRLSKRYGGPEDLKINTDVMNKSQQILQHISSRLDSNLMEREFRDDPTAAIKRLKSEVRHLLEDTSPVEFTERDAINMLSLKSMKGFSTENALRSLKNSAQSVANIHRMAQLSRDKKSASIITLDFETISRDTSGPEWLARDAFTEITKVGFTSSTMENGKITVNDVDDIISDHGYKNLDAYGVPDKLAEWLRSDLGPKFNNASKQEVWTAWGQKIKAQSDNYRNRGGRTFKNNHDMVQHLAQMLIQKIKAARDEGKEVFFTTKNASFDLTILAAKAPHEWAEIKKLVSFIDVQASAQFENKLKGKDESLALNKMIMNMIGGKDAYSYNIDVPGNAEKAFTKLRNRLPISVSDNVNKILQDRKYMHAAHSEPVADLMFTKILLADQFHRIMSGDKTFENLPEIVKFYINDKKLKGAEESFLEAQLTETDWMIEGMRTSATMLSHGNMAKRIVSLMSANILLPTPDTPFGKQLNQHYAGLSYRPNHAKNLHERINLKDRKIGDELFTAAFISQGEVSAQSYLLDVHANKNYFMKHVYVETLATYNPWRGRDGYAALSDRVYDQITARFEKNIDLTDVSSGGVGTEMTQRNQEVVNLITKRAKKLSEADRGHPDQPSQQHYQIAANEIVNELSKGKGGIPLPKGAFISKGDRGYETVSEEFNGQITNILIDADSHDKIRMHAQIEYLASGPELTKHSHVGRWTSAKALMSQDFALSMGNAYYKGLQGVVNADFLEKNYTGAYKQIMLDNIVRSYIRMRENPRSSFEQSMAVNGLKQLSKLTHSQEMGISLVHNPSIDPTFTHITDPEDIALAKKFVGNINLSHRELGTHMANAGLIWDLQKAKDWYSAAGGGNLARGQDNMRRWITNALKDSHEDLKQQRSQVSNALHALSDSEFENFKNDMAIPLKEWQLPDLDRIARGEKIPMFWGLERRNSDPTTPFEIGVRHTPGVSLNGFMTGKDVKSKNLKFKGNLFQQLDNLPQSHLSPTTMNHLKMNRRAYLDSRFTAALKTYDDFRDALLSKAHTEVKNLTIGEIEKLNESLGRLELDKLKKWDINDANSEEIKRKIVDSFLGKFEGDTAKQNEVADKIIDELKQDRYSENIKKSKRFISASAAQEIAKLGDKSKGGKPVHKWSLPDEAITFDFNEDLLNFLPDDQIDKARKSLMDTFKTMAEKPGGLVESIEENGKKAPIVKLKSIIMHADSLPENVYNILNDKGGQHIFGMRSESNVYKTEVTRAIEVYYNMLGKYKSGKIGAEAIEKSKHMIKKQWLNYMIKGFMLDSSSIYTRANEYSPLGFRASTATARSVVDNAQEILKNLETKEFKQFAEYRTTLEHIANKSHLADVYMNAETVKRMEIEQGVTVNSHLKSLFNSKDGETDYRSIMKGEKAIYAYSSRDPQYAHGMDAFLDKRLYLIPPELSMRLGISTNSAHVFPEHNQFFNNDFDGDRISFVVKAAQANQTYMNYHAQHEKELRDSIESLKTSTTKGGVPFKDKISQLEMVGITAQGKILAKGRDEQGYYVEKLFDTNSKEADAHMGLFFGMVSKQSKEFELHRHEFLNNKLVREGMDAVAAVTVAKDMIGITTNLSLSLRNQIMAVNQIGKDSLLAKSLIGNLNEGYAGISQMFIGLAKHPDAIGRLSLAVKALQNPFTKDEEAQKALKQTWQSFYKEIPDGEKFGEQVYNGFQQLLETFRIAAPKNSRAYKKIMAMRAVDFTTADANILSSIVAKSDAEFVNDELLRETPVRSNVAELGDYLTKQFKLDTPEARGIFKKGAKFAAIGAAAYLIGNFFRPNQLSNSMNPLDGFADIGSDIDGNRNIITSNLELDRSVPLDMVNASFSKQAFIKMTQDGKAEEESKRSKIVNKLLEDALGSNNPLLTEWRSSPNLTYSNYTTFIPRLGSNQLNRSY